jgi:hypothetical protein
MCRVVHSYYSKLYTLKKVNLVAQKYLLSLINNKFNRKTRETLNTNLIVKEFKDTLKPINSNKASGLNSLSPVFYKTFSNIILSLMLKMVRKAFNTAVFSAELAVSQIILLYKNNNSILIQSYQLIILLNINYKIATKALAKRFFKVLADVVSLY